MTPSRRDLLKVAGLAAAATVAPGLLRPGPARAAGATRTVTLTGTAAGLGTYAYHPFEVPPGVHRLDVTIAKDGVAKTGIGLFDQRGAHYATLGDANGFRGIYGEERSEFFVASDAASESFLPGPVEPGTWTVIVPVFQAEQPVPYTITVTLTDGPQGGAVLLGEEVGVVVDAPGWYRGDLHAHTPASSDAWRSRSAFTPARWADECRRIGLDFLALTDHNVVSQNMGLADAAGEDVLLMAGEEMTNWFHGHATVSGMAPGDWLDWRQRPLGVPLDPEHEATIAEFVTAARATGAYISAAHPLGATLKWDFFPEAAASVGSRTDGLEVWTGQFQPDDEAAVAAWDQMLTAGQRIFANGGSDLHGAANTNGFVAGTPTTVVAAERLAKADVVTALKAGRSFVTRLPDGVELFLTGTGPGGQRQIMGGTLYGSPADVIAVSLRVRGGAGMRLEVVRDGVVTSVHRLTGADETVEVAQPVGAGGFVRAQVRSAPQVDPTNPLAGRLDMEALCNPVFLEVGAVPPGVAPDQTRPPAEPGPRRRTGPTPVVPEAPLALLLPLAGAAVAAGVARRRSAAEVPPLVDLAGLRVLAAAGSDDEVTVVATVVCCDDGGVLLAGEVDGCCGATVQARVRVTRWPGEAPAAGTRWTVTGVPTTAEGEVPGLRALSVTRG